MRRSRSTFPLLGLAVLAVAVLAAPPAAAQSPAAAAPVAELPPVRSFVRNADINAMQLSPSGKWLAMIVAGAGNSPSLAVVDTDGKVAPTIAASFTDAAIRSFRWVGDERLVFNVRDDLSGGTEQRFGPGLFSVQRDGKGMRELIRPRWNFFRTRITNGPETLDPRHELFAVPRDGSDEVIVGEYQFTSRGELDAVNALRLNVVTGRTRSLSLARPDHVTGWLFDPKGEPRVTISQYEGVRTVYWRAPGRQGWDKIDTAPSLRTTFSPRFVDETGRLYVTTNSGRGGTATLKLFDFATGAPQADAIVSTPGFDFSGKLISDGVGDDAFGLRILTDAETTVWFDPGMKALQKRVDERLPGRINSLSCSRCKDPEIVLVRSWSDRDPGAWYLYRPRTDAWNLLGRVRTDIVPARMATLDFLRTKARDGLDLPLWVTTPLADAPGKRDGKRPAVVLVHGGPWVRGGSWGWDGEAQFLASRGYVVIEPEYRGSTGYGAAHFRAGWKHWEQEMQDDVADALKAVVDQGLVDPERVCIAGASYGGYATLMGLARYPDRYRCGVAWVAVTDPRLLFEDNWDNDMSDEARNHSLPAMLGDPQRDAAMLKAAAPVERAAEIKAPLLMAFGRDDRRVPLKHGTRMRDALKAQGRDPQWVVYDGEGHGWFKVDNRVDFWTRVERFLGAQIGGGTAP